MLLQKFLRLHGSLEFYFNTNTVIFKPTNKLFLKQVNFSMLLNNTKLYFKIFNIRFVKYSFIDR